MPVQNIVIKERYFINVLNLSQLTKPQVGTKINPEKAREILDTNIFELLPTQTTRQDQINDFFNEFNDLIGQVPQFADVDGDGAGEKILNNVADRTSRIDLGVNPNAYITRLNRHTIEAAPNGPANVGKTLESMRNKLNTYLGDVDNVVQVIEDQRPEYENKSSGFLKIRKPNQAIILRNSNNLLEFQKTAGPGPSFLTVGFTITMWVRFVGKTGRGTLFNFANPTSTESPYGFRLETITREDDGVYRRMVRLVVRGNRSAGNDMGNLYDSHFGTQDVDRHDTVSTGTVLYGDENISLNAFNAHTQIPTDDLNEWFFICATYNPTIMKEWTFNQQAQWAEVPNYLRDKQVWLNHRELNNTLAASTQYGAKCKVEVISRSDLLRARGYKVGSLGVNVKEETTVTTDDENQQDQGQGAN